MFIMTNDLVIIKQYAAKLLQSCPTLCDPTNGSSPGSPVPGILQARTLERVAISFSNAWQWKLKVKSAQSCPTLGNPMDCSPPGSSIHGILQARVLERGAISFSPPLRRGISFPILRWMFVTKLYIVLWKPLNCCLSLTSCQWRELHRLQSSMGNIGSTLCLLGPWFLSPPM